MILIALIPCNLTALSYLPFKIPGLSCTSMLTRHLLNAWSVGTVFSGDAAALRTSYGREVGSLPPSNPNVSSLAVVALLSFCWETYTIIQVTG